MKIFHKLNSAVYNFWSNTINNSREIRVWQKSDRQGNIYWLVFDPVTGYYSSFSDEREVRIWIEERYYRPPNR